MAAKKYVAKSHVSLSVKMTAEKNARISFTPLTGGGSVYYTSDERVQEALEQHPKFGKLFKEDVLYKERKAVVAEPAPEKKRKEIAEVHVTCLDDAKDYLSDKYGISRTKLRSQESILKAAAANNIHFIGLEE
jgi:hypothetical protein